MVRLIECVTDELSPNWNSKAFELNCLELIIMFESLYFTPIFDHLLKMGNWVVKNLCHPGQQSIVLNIEEKEYKNQIITVTK